MAFTTRWLAPAIVAAALGAASLTPAPAHAQSDTLSRAIVDIANVVFQGGQAYDRSGDYGRDDRLVAGRDRYGRTVYYRVPQDSRYGGNYYGNQTRNSPPYGNAYGYYGHAQDQQRVKCNKHGKCKSEYYDGRYDRNDRDDDDEDDDGDRNDRYGRYGDNRYGDERYGSNGYNSRVGHYVYDAFGRRRWVY